LPTVDPGSLDLARGLQATADVCAVAAGRHAELFIIGRPAHKDARQDLRQGRSNGGHFFLPDNEFAHLRADGCAGIVIHAVPPQPLQTGDMAIGPSAANDEEFLQLLALSRLPNARLATYDPDGRIGQRIRTYDNSFDHTVTATRVIDGAIADPSCPAEAIPLSWSLSEQTDYTWTVTSQPDPDCLAGTQLDAMVNGERRTLQGDANGVFTATARFRPGVNRITVLVPGGGERVVYERDLPPRPDKIEVTMATSASKATLNGVNPLRDRNSKAEIQHVQSGRRYTARVDGDGRYTVVVPLAPGNNEFTIQQLSGQPLTVKVENGTQCPDQPAFEVQRGTLLLALQNACRGGKPVTFTYHGKDWRRIFSPDGHAEVKIPLGDGSTHDIFYTTDGGERRLLVVPWQDQAKYLTVTLGWQTDGIDLDEHVFEPGFQFGGKGHIYFGNLTNGIGALDIDDRGEHVGSYHEEHYVVDRDVLKASGGKLEIMVDHYSRYGGGMGRPARAPFCDGGASERIPFTVTIQDGVKPAETIPLITPPIACGAKPGPRERLLPIRTITIN
jgi:uncharacterized protein YfaP (DUF2135 family)